MTEESRTETLVNRLRGIYTVPVSDGAGLLNGSDTFTRKFEGLPPINEEAAQAIESLVEQLREAVETLEDLASFSLEYFEKQKRVAGEISEHLAFLEKWPNKQQPQNGEENE